MDAKLRASAEAHDLAGVTCLLAAGAAAASISDDGLTALMLACSTPESSSEGAAVVLKLISVLGMRTIDKRSVQGRYSALHMAARHGSTLIVQTLLEAGVICLV